MTQYRVAWEMPPSITGVANIEMEADFHGWQNVNWGQRLPDEVWMEHENVTTDKDAALDQYRQLRNWAQSKEQPIRKVTIQQRPEGGWEDFAGDQDEDLLFDDDEE